MATLDSRAWVRCPHRCVTAAGFTVNEGDPVELRVLMGCRRFDADTGVTGDHVLQGDPKTWQLTECDDPRVAMRMDSGKWIAGTTFISAN